MLSMKFAEPRHGCVCGRDAESGKLCAGYVVVTGTETLQAISVPSHLSAQAAELIALTETCKLAKDKIVNIYTDS